MGHDPVYRYFKLPLHPLGYASLLISRICHHGFENTYWRFNRDLSIVANPFP